MEFTPDNDLNINYSNAISYLIIKTQLRLLVAILLSLQNILANYFEKFYCN